MKKIICKKVYDTDDATLVRKITSGRFGDSDGYEEDLFVTATGNYFLYVNGGETSVHPKEDIIRMSKEKATEWEKNV